MSHLRILKLCILGLLIICISSCSGPHTLITSGVTYQSLRLNNQKNPTPPKGIHILAKYTISEDGELTINIQNPTDKIMSIELNKSFVVNSNGVSQSIEKGKSGIKTIAPRATCIFKDIKINKIGSEYLSKSNFSSFKMDPQNSVCKFEIMISYFLENCEAESLTSEFFVNSQIYIPIEKRGKVNEAFTKIYKGKNDAIYEPWWMLKVNDNMESSYYSINNTFIDYK